MGLEIGFAIGAIILLGAMIWGATANTRRNRANDAVTQKATKELFADPAGYDTKEDALRSQTRQ